MPELKEMKKLSVEMEKLPREISRFARLSNLSRREDSRHIFICPLVVVVMVMVVQRGNVFLLHESEREREREREAKTRFNRRYTDDNNGENSRYSVNRKGEGEKRQEGEEKERDRRERGEKEEGEESRRVVDGLGGCASNKFPAWIMYRSP